MSAFSSTAERPEPRGAGAGRGGLAGLALSAAVAWAAPALAAPTCLDAAGATVRCESPGALPVGASPAAPTERQGEAPLPAPEVLFGLVCVLGGLFVLIGLMPDFDGWGGEQDGGRKHD